MPAFTNDTTYTGALTSPRLSEHQRETALRNELEEWFSDANAFILKSGTRNTSLDFHFDVIDRLAHFLILRGV